MKATFIFSSILFFLFNFFILAILLFADHVSIDSKNGFNIYIWIVYSYCFLLMISIIILLILIRNSLKWSVKRMKIGMISMALGVMAFVSIFLIGMAQMADNLNTIN